MAESRGYELTATTDGPRLQSEVVRRLAGRPRRATRSARRSSSATAHGSWPTWSARACPAPAPPFVHLPDQYGQDMVVDYRREKVIQRAAPEATRPRPQRLHRLAARAGAPGSYSYEDTLSTPRLKVTNERVITYRLLDYGDMTVFHEIDGLRGRPTTGVLGVLFQMIGEGNVVESRMALATDGVQVSRARAEALIEVATTVTVHPDGRTEKDVPAGTGGPGGAGAQAEGAAPPEASADRLRGAVAPRRMGA